MENENIETVVDESADYIQAIQELKQNSVSKDEYEKLKQERSQLLNALKNGETVKEEVKPVDVDELRKDIFNKEQSNLNFIEKSLQLRDELIRNGEADPFLPVGKNIMPTEEDIATANRVADVMNECVEYADGDSSIFTNELQRRTADTAPITRRKIY